MTLQPRVIAPIGSGLNRYFPSWTSPEDSFFEMDNCYAKRGRIQKRQGSVEISRAPAYIPSTGGSFNFTVTSIVPATQTVTMTANAATGITAGQRVWLQQGGVEIGAFIVMSVALGVPETLTLQYVPNTPISPLVGPPGQPRSILTNGAVVVYLPIQGLLGFETQAGNEQTRLVVCTAKQLCTYNPATGLTTEITPSVRANSRNYEMFQGNTFSGSLYLTNFRDPVYRYDGSTFSVPTFTVGNQFNPGTGAPEDVIIRSARVVIPYRGRLVLLNTWEGFPTTSASPTQQPYPQRARWSAAGLDPTAAGSWGYPVYNGATFADAATGQAIVGAAIVRDQLIVYFERSIWCLKYTDNPLSPFVWELVNDQYGAGSTLGVWSFDDSALGISQQGLVACNGSDTKRIDLPVLDIVQNIETSNQNQAGGPIDQRDAINYRRVTMQQDYFNQQMLIAYPGEQTSTNYVQAASVRNNNFLIWNYLENSWAQALGYYTTLFLFRTTGELTWGSLTDPWSSYTQPWSTYGAVEGKLTLAAGHDSGKLLEITDNSSKDVDAYGNEVPLSFSVTTNFHNPFLAQLQRVRVPYIDIYCVPQTRGTVTVNTYVDDALLNPEPGGADGNPSTTRTVPITGDRGGAVTRVYTGVTGRNVAFQVTLTPEQSQLYGDQDFELQGILVHCCPAGRYTNVSTP